MIRAFYTASSGLVAQTTKQDIIANNIANANTTGFKRQKAVSVSFADELTSQISHVLMKERPPYPDVAVASQIVGVGSSVDHTQGSIRDTGNKKDLAIVGPGEFVVSIGKRMTTTRAGNFQMNANHELCTAEGAILQGENGPVEVPDGEWKVGADGSVTDSTGSVVNKIKILGAADGETRIEHECLEEANVNIVREMVDMIANMRAYEANQKVVASVDGTLEQLFQVGKV